MFGIKLKRKEKGSQVSEKDQRYYKGKIRTFFVGSVSENAIKRIPLIDLGITNITFLKTKDAVSITIESIKPSILIGYQGKMSKRLSKYLSVGEEFVKITIVESNLWK